MAKRRRLTPAQAGYLEPASKAPEVKSFFTTAPPIAQVAGEAAASAALQEVTDRLRQARDGGLLVQKLPLSAVMVDHLSRDRLMADAEDLKALVESIRSHGQRTPIEVVDLDNGTYGLISGWRRLTALEMLAKETGDAAYETVLALLRRPDSASDAYVAMVEENEVRVGLSYYERARVAALAVGQGVFATEKLALQRLFATASRAKRSKIGSFLTLYHALDGSLRFPTQLSERLGLKLAKTLEQGRGAAEAISAALAETAPQTPEQEQAILLAAVTAGQGETPPPERQPQPTTKAQGVKPAAKPVEIRPGVFLKNQGGYLKPRLLLEGPNVDARFQERLEAWLKTNL